MPRPDRTTQSPGPDEDTKVCPYCAEVIKAAAIKCRYCQSDLADAPVRPAAEPPAEPQVSLAKPAPSRPAGGGAAAGSTAVAAERLDPSERLDQSDPSDQSEQPLDAAPRDPVRRRWFLLATGLALALVLLFLTLAFLDWRAARDLAASEDAARTVRASVTDKVEALLSYDHATFDEDLGAAQEGMTPSFQEEYEPTIAEIRDRALAQERSQQADVVAVAVVSQSREEVETLVFVNTISSREGAQQQRLMQNRVTVRMVKADGTWLIDELSVPQS